jgi:serine/threonine protein phosphatase PrpC
MRLISAGKTDIGRKRDHNEDYYFLNNELGLFIVCDGMGGHAAGEVASKIATETVNLFIESTARDADITWPFEFDETLSLASNRLKAAIRLANQRVISEIKEKTQYRGMGTTIASTIFLDETAHVAHVGDSRIYLLRNDTLRRLTRDHSWIDEQLHQGVITPAEARKHPLRNVITRALGSREEVIVDVKEEKVQDGDIFVLCSDGLTGMVEDEEIETILQKSGRDVEKACGALIDAANQHGGEDNISVILIQCFTQS